MKTDKQFYTILEEFPELIPIIVLGKNSMLIALLQNTQEVTSP